MFSHSAREQGTFRGWVHYGKDSRLAAHVELSWSSRHCLASFGYHEEGGWGFTLAFAPLFLSVGVEVSRPFRLRRSREIQVSFHGGAMWWHLWCDPWGDERRWSKLRYGSFHFDDFLLGRSKCERSTIEERQVLVPMSERSYQATAKLVLYEWKRPRWFTKRMKRCEINVPEGIPHEGKGENSWDCGTDATFGITTGECYSIPQGVGILVGSVLRDRVRYGGWSDWSWNKPRA